MIKDSAKTILCYGDSNTWGSIPRTDDRYQRSVRWPGALQNLLGDEYEVVSEGLCGRTLVVVDSKKPHRTGITHLQSILESHEPIDLVIMMLGTNDIKSTYNLSPEQIAEHLQQTISFIQDGPSDLQKIPKILVVCPPPILTPDIGTLDERVARGIELFKVLPNLYRQVAEKNNCDFINAGDHMSSSKVDGYHFTKEGHLKLAEVFAGYIKNSKL